MARTTWGLILAATIVAVLVWWMASNWRKGQPRSWFGAVAEVRVEAVS
ncbi:MAG: hypothetical protein M3P24_08355 [Gemmatimonadota bacterium]|nr:hypothetical protein [Gemmatimonadota bacterium]